ncbi:glycerophosphoryl diester phosphodiesterase membrane domain-containing protein [uncultured Actinomyces sp.]|uniref:glycerophosphoryl diester phosphodiesterase membrane domain-containing protein n=1 Tax=uncultured Actinomyces sp. TaxID=249061 RepID=UPI0028E9F63A|nr:glycerophosphoryl diester phosphodiesterase membrane domain-containing protein [uncultured Actinomyces sp.]
MSSPWTSPDPTQYVLGHADAVPPQNGQAAQTPQPAYPGPSGQPAFAPPGAGPAGVAAPQPAYAAPDTPGNSAPTASGYSQASTWSWAPKPGIIPLRPLTLTDLFSGSFSALRKNPSVLFGFTIIVMTVVALLSLAGTMLPLFSFTSLMSNDLDPQASSKALLDSAYLSVVSTIVGYIALLAGSFLAGTVLDGVLSVAVSQLVIGKKITFKQSWALVKPRLWSMLGASLLSMLAVGSPLLVLVILFFMSLYSWPGSDAFFSLFGLLLALALPVVLVSYVISIRFLYAPICAVLEEKGPIEAVKRSWALTSGSFWVTLGRVILINVVVGFIAGLIVQIIGIIAVIFMFTILGDPSSDPSTVWSTIILYGVISALQMLAYSLVVPILAAYQTLMYVDEKIRKENFAPLLAHASQG